MKPQTIFDKIWSHIEDLKSLYMSSTNEQDNEQDKEI